MEVALPVPDYRKEVVSLLKEKTPVLIAGIAIFFMLISPLIQRFTFQRENTRKSQSISVDPQTKIYTVQAGDDLWKIAEKMYGSGLNAYDIARVNKLSEPFTVTENQILIIPQIRSKMPTQGDLTETGAFTKHVSEYTVQAGDFLWHIAEKVYGDGNQMGKLIDANSIPYPYNVEEGQKLRVP